MATVTLPKTMTVEEFLALPEDGVDRELIYGEVQEKGMTVRNEIHSLVMASITRHLGNWAASHTSSVFQVLCGEAGFVLDRVENLVVGIDVAIKRFDVGRGTPPRTTMVDGSPHLAVEILSPSDSQREIHEKVRLYLDHGVAAVWIVDSDDQSVRIFRRNVLTTFHNGEQTLTCEPELPGFSVRVSELFR